MDDPITLDALAAMTARGFSDVHAAFKDIRAELADMRSTTTGDVAALTTLVTGGFGSLGGVLKTIQEDVHHWKGDVVDLDERVARIEKHLGLRT